MEERKEGKKRKRERKEKTKSHLNLELAIWLGYLAKPPGSVYLLCLALWLQVCTSTADISHGHWRSELGSSCFTTGILSSEPSLTLFLMVLIHFLSRVALTTGTSFIVCFWMFLFSDTACPWVAWYYINQAIFELKAILSQSSKCWHYRRSSLYLALHSPILKCHSTPWIKVLTQPTCRPKSLLP